MINETIAKKTLDVLIESSESFKDLFFTEKIYTCYIREYDFDLNIYKDKLKKKWVDLNKKGALIYEQRNSG